MIDQKLVSIFKSFVDQDFRIVAFSNDRSFANDAKASYEYLIKLMDVPILWIICKVDDYFALPCTGMWEYFCSNLNENIPIDLESSKLILNPFNPFLPIKHTQSIKFSLNLGLSTIPLESLASPISPPKQIPQAPGPNPIRPYQIKKRGSVFQGEEIQSEIPSSSPEVIIFVGPPGSGKSTFYKTHLKRYNWINCDKYRTKSKCLEILDKSLQKNKSCVVDNLNSTKSLRYDYIQIAKKYSVTIRCFVFNIDKELALHLDRLRKINRNRKHISGFVGEVAINKFFRDFEQPEMDEGFDEIKKVELVAGPFENSEDEKMFYSYT